MENTGRLPDNKVLGANMGPIWGRHASGGPHVGPINFAIWDVSTYVLTDGEPRGKRKYSLSRIFS